jgi:hypothetical protein
MVASVNGSSKTEYVSGVVSAANERGLKLRGEAQWRNYSKWASDIAQPEAGQCVRVGVDASGFVRSVEAEPTASRLQPPEGVLGQPAERPDRETAITRLAVLRDAVAFIGYAGGTVEDVLLAAAEFERWILRP